MLTLPAYSPPAVTAAQGAAGERPGAVALPAAGQPTNTVSLGEQHQGGTGYDYGYGAGQSDCVFPTMTARGPVSAGGKCTANYRFIGGIGPIIEINSAASVDAGGLLHAKVAIDGSLPRVPSSPAVPYGYSAGLGGVTAATRRRRDLITPRAGRRTPRAPRPPRAG